MRHWLVTSSITSTVYISTISRFINCKMPKVLSIIPNFEAPDNNNGLVTGNKIRDGSTLLIFAAFL